MIRSGRGAARLRRLVLVPAAVAIPLLMAGCEAGNNAPVLNFHFPTDAAGTTDGDLSIANVFVLGGPLGTNLAAGQSAGLFLAVTNTGRPDRLVGVTAPGTATSVHLPAGGIPIGSPQQVLLSGPKPQLYLVGLTTALRNGTAIRVVLHFVNAGAISLDVPVFARAGHLTTLAPVPSATPTVSPGHKLRPTPGTGLSPTPSTTPSP